MNKVFLALLLSGAVLPAFAAADSAAQAERDAWLAFANARGEASLIRGDVNHPTANDVFRVIPDVGALGLEEEKLQLGLELFSEARLSRDGSIACVSCHVSMLGGVDRRPLPFGIDGIQGSFNVPTMFNAALNFRQFWDGRALTLQEQALGPIQNPAEFGHDLDGAVAVLQTIPEYASAFDRLYPDGVTAANLGAAIAYYETMNFTGLDSPFLRQLRGEENSMTDQARRGQQRFVEIGCASCHNGINLGGNSYQQLGVARPWYDGERPAGEEDNGLFGRSGREQDRHVFKVPTLHHVTLTGPWLHDGSIVTLQQTVDWMARYQSGRYLENRDIDDIVAFLRTLGDPIGMLGDCSASGNYSPTMDCSVSGTATVTERDDPATPVQATLPEGEELARLHQAEYSAALQLTSAAPARIATEMDRIRSGEVAHYDFLQYEHIEMLRHARALSHPPANLAPARREAALSQAARWQQAAEEYEYLIADFLRAQAVASNARANYQDLLRVLSVGADEKTVSMLAQAEQRVLKYYENPGADSQLELERATSALQELDLNTERLEELQVQVEMLVETNDTRARSKGSEYFDQIKGSKGSEYFDQIKGVRVL